MSVHAIQCGVKQPTNDVVARLHLQEVEGLQALKKAFDGNSVTLAVEIQFDHEKGTFAIVRLTRLEPAELEKGTTARDDPAFLGRRLALVESGPMLISAHAAERWAHAIVPLIDSPTDPRTIECWSKWIAASPGAVRNWCHTAGIGPRCSLVFGRLLRAVILTDNGRHKLENILDVVDRRTLAAMLKQAGFRPGETFPPNVSGFLQQQTLIRDDDMLNQLKRVLATRGADEKTTDSRGERTATRTGQLSDRRTV